MQNESQKTFIFTAEAQPILSKDSARRAQSRAEDYFTERGIGHPIRA